MVNKDAYKAIAGCPLDSSSSRTARQHTQRATPRSAQNWLRTGVRTLHHATVNHCIIRHLITRQLITDS